MVACHNSNRTHGRLLVAASTCQQRSPNLELDLSRTRTISPHAETLHVSGVKQHRLICVPAVGKKIDHW
jgi:hypothetical protein